MDTYEALRGLRTFEEMTTYELAIARNSYKLSGNGEPDRVSGVMVADNFFPFLGVSPQLGRTFTAEECQTNGPGAVILSHGLWERRYRSNPSVIGSSLLVNDRAATIVGVMPPTFDFGAVFVPGTRVEVFMPAVLDVLRSTVRPWRSWAGSSPAWHFRPRKQKLIPSSNDKSVSTPNLERITRQSLHLCVS